MRKMRKGFTLVELLIIVAIIGALAAVMMVSSGSSIAKAKATTIANNLKICGTGAQLYFLQSGDNDTTEIGTITTKEVLKATVPNFDDFTSAGGNISYTSGDETGPSNWQVTVTLGGADSQDILNALKQIKGFSELKDRKPIIYKLFTGKVSSGS